MNARIVSAFLRSSDHLCLYGQSPLQCLEVARECCGKAIGRRTVRQTQLELDGGGRYPVRSCLGYVELNMEGMQPRTWTLLVRRWNDPASPRETVLLKSLDKAPSATRHRAALFLGAEQGVGLPRFIATCWHPDAVHPALRSVAICIGLSTFRTAYAVNQSRERRCADSDFAHLPQIVLAAFHRNPQKYSRQDVHRIALLLAACLQARGTPCDHLEALRGIVDM